MAAAAGVLLADRRAEHVADSHVAALRNAYEVEFKARYMLHTAIWGHPTSRRVQVMDGLGAVAGNRGGGDVESMAGASPSDDDSSSKEATLKLLTSRSLSEAERTACARKAISPALLSAINALYGMGIATFPSSSILHLFAARFDSQVRNNKVSGKGRSIV